LLRFEPSTRPPEPCAKEEGKPADIGGYYQPDDKKASAALRPSGTLNQILASI
jgi:monomeric isocitrate dehydrogenase